MRKVFALLIAATLGIGILPGHAFHADDLPLIASAEGLSNGWLSLRLGIGGTQGAIDLMGTGVDGPTQAGLSFYDENGGWLGAFVFTGFPGKKGHQINLLPPDGPINVDEVTDNTAEGLFGLGIHYNDPEFTTEPFNGVQHVVLWWAGGSEFSWAVRGEDGFTVDARDSGTGAWIYDSDDFTNAAYAQVHDTNGVTGAVGVHAQLQGDVPLTVENALIGFYTFGLTAAGSLTMTTPAGDRSCNGFELPVSSGFVGGSTCFFGELEGANAMTPGEYILHATSAGAGFTGAFEDIWFGGADARLPA